MAKITDFIPNHYYYKQEWKDTYMAVTVGEDFNYTFGIYRDGQFFELQKDFSKDLKLTDDFCEYI